MPHYAAFHLVFAVCQSTHLGVSSIQRVNAATLIFIIGNALSISTFEIGEQAIVLYYIAMVA